jgi:hypothetical protein
MKAALLGLAVILMTFGLVGTTAARSGADAATVRVEPATVGAGESVTFEGVGMSPGSARALVLAGGHLVIGLGAVRTDASGQFSTVVGIPGHLPPGSYELRAIADDTLVAMVAVTGAAASGARSGMAAPSAGVTPTEGGTSTRVTVMLGLAALMIVAALVVAWRAERAARSWRPGRR